MREALPIQWRKKIDRGFMRTALLLMAHGSQHAEANADLFHIAAELRAQGRYAVVEASFLELAPPAIEEGGARCVSQGAERVVMVPYFLSAGVHVRRDLTACRDRLAARFRHVQFILAEALGRHPLLVKILGDRVREAQEHASISTPAAPGAP
jgi:sirohydrochlorin ferrochelatase